MLPVYKCEKCVYNFRKKKKEIKIKRTVHREHRRVTNAVNEFLKVSIYQKCLYLQSRVKYTK